MPPSAGSPEWAARTGSVTTIVPVSLALAWVSLHVAYRIYGAMPQPWLEPFFLIASFFVLAVAVAVPVLLSRPAPQDWMAAPGRVDRLLSWLLVVVVATDLYGMFPNRVAMPAILVLLPAAWWGIRALTPVAVYAIALGATFVAKTAMIRMVPVDPVAADMLPYIEHASRAWRAGRNPYEVEFSAIGPNPFYYLPFLWWPYSIADALSFDPRWINLAAVAVICLPVLRSVVADPSRRVALGLLAIVLASRPSLDMLVQGHVWPFWALVALLAQAMAAGRHLLAALVVGCLLSLHQTMPLLAVFAAICWFRDTGPWRLAVCVGCALAVPAVVLWLPFGSPWESVRLLFAELPARSVALAMTTNRNPFRQVSILALLANLGWLDARLWLQILSCLAGALALLRWRGPPVLGFCIIGGVTYCLTMSLNGQVFHYYYVPGALLIIGGLAFVDAAAGERRLNDAR